VFKPQTFRLNQPMTSEQPPELPDKLDFRTGRVTERLGVVAAAGYQPLPDVLLFHQKELGLSSEELNVTLHILAHWYAPERLPFPSAKTIARRMGVADRTVERYLTSLRKKRVPGQISSSERRPAEEGARFISAD
jgi:hypothetical protein